MKRYLLITASCFLFALSVFPQKLINQPMFGKSTHPYLTIQQVEINKDATILRMKINMDPQTWFRIDKSTYIVADGNKEKLFIDYGDGVILGQKMYTQKGISTFSLYFPPIDTATKKITFIEGDCQDCYRIYDIALQNNQPLDFSNSEYIAIGAPITTPKIVNIINQVSSSNQTSSGSGNASNVQNSSISYDGSPFNFVFSWKRKNRLEPHWNGLGMAFINLDGDLGTDLSLSTSHSFVFNPIECHARMNDHFLLVTGVGVDWSRYHFKGNKGLEVVDGIAQFVQAPEGVNYTSSKLLSYYFTFPLLIEYQKKIIGKHDIHLSAGVVGYFKCYSKSQVDYEDHGHTIKETKGRDLNLLPVNARAMATIGFGDVTLYGYYGLHSLFEKGKGPDVRPTGIGVMLDF